MAPKHQWRHLDQLIIVAGHAVYVGKDQRTARAQKSWVLQDFQRGEQAYYIQHIRSGVELAALMPKSLLVFSGGQTRLQAGPRSEAQSYRALADQFGWWQKPEVQERATIEQFARDSFENVLFSIARFRECTGRYPNSIKIVGWAFKRERFDFHRQTVRWPGDDRHYKYYDVNNPDDPDRSLKGEAKTLAAFKQDPFGTEEPLRSKREHRNPFRQKPPYSATCSEISALLAHNSRNGETFQGMLPWDSETIGTVPEKTAHSWNEFLMLVGEAEEFLVGAAPNHCRPRLFWYRGHDHGNYTLTPSLDSSFRNSSGE